MTDANGTMYYGEVRCLQCDPLFVLQAGLCVSDGQVEFSSPVYHAVRSDGFAKVRVHRMLHSLDPDSATDDTDGDGVCDSDDICEGGRDERDFDGDTIFDVFAGAPMYGAGAAGRVASRADDRCDSSVFTNLAACVAAG